MKSSLLLSAALVLLLPVALPAFAQEEAGGVNVKANTRASHRAQQTKSHAATQAAPDYPNATRTFPEQVASKAVAKQMEELFKLQEKDDAADQIIAKANEIINNPGASAYDKSSAAYIAAGAYQGKESGNYADAIKYYQMAVDANGLHNNNHYRALMQLAQLNEADEHHAEALAAIDRFITETKSEDTNAWTIKTQILLSMNRPKDAVVAVEKLLAAKPNDKKLMMTLAGVYQQAGDDAKAAEVFDRMHKAGLFTESKDYEMGFHLLVNIEGRQKDALALIDEGLKNGILQPSYDMYAIQGQAAYAADDIKGAIAAYSKGAPMGKDGGMYLNLAQMQLEENHYAEAKAAAQAAHDKGVKRMGVYWQSMARAENGLGNAAAAKAALQEAAKYPETKKWAETALRQGLAK